MSPSEISVSDVVSLLNALASFAILAVIVWVVSVLRQHPGSKVSVEIPKIGKGEVSIEDAGWMIKDQLSLASDAERQALVKFNNEQRTPHSEELANIEPCVLEELHKHNLVKRHKDIAVKERYRLALWGYRRLKDFMKVGEVVKPWEWLDDGQRRKIDDSSSS